MIKVRKDFTNKDFIEFLGITNINFLERFDEQKLFDSIKKYNRENKDTVSVVFLQYDFSPRDRCLYINAGVINGSTRHYKVGDRYTTGFDFLGLNIEKYADVEDPTFRSYERKLEKYFDENCIDIMICNELCSSSGYAEDYDNEFHV